MGWFTRLAAWWDKKFHVHNYSDSAWNYYWYSGERKCRCGDVQHREMVPFVDTPWVPGPHPIAESLRAQGLLETRDPRYKKSL